MSSTGRRLHAPPPAAQHEGKYSDARPDVTYVYMSANFLDDLAFAAAWLYRATGGCGGGGCGPST